MPRSKQIIGNGVTRRETAAKKADTRVERIEKAIIMLADKTKMK